MSGYYKYVGPHEEVMLSQAIMPPYEIISGYIGGLFFFNDESKDIPRDIRLMTNNQLINEAFNMADKFQLFKDSILDDDHEYFKFIMKEIKIRYDMGNLV